MAPNKPHAPDATARDRPPFLRLVVGNGDRVAVRAEDEAEFRFFSACGMGKPHLRSARAAAQRNGTSLERELIAAGRIAPDVYYRWLASHLGLAYINTIQPAQVLALRNQDLLLRELGPLRISLGDRVVTVIRPEARRLDADMAMIARHPALRELLVVAAPQTMRTAVWESGAAMRVREATSDLADRSGSVSARQVMTGFQGFLLAAGLALTLATALIAPVLALIGLHVLLTGLFFAHNALRFGSILFRRPIRAVAPSALEASGLPVYTVMVAVYDEAEMAGQLVQAMSRLNWPKSLLDIKLVCEADDRATIEALEAEAPGPEFEIIRVPAFGPRTKPKALQYALAGARGHLVAIYDAEDVPHPDQLLEAHAAFAAGGTDLACVQAPLAIANRGSNWLAGLFALEYSGLFRVLIPFLVRCGLPIPLGGTSNHFRKDILESVGGWDPYNVTEDADLGLRLYRQGYRTEAISRATVEIAPHTMSIWLKQRSRWLKGWAQTWLVLMRHPLHLLNELGFGGFLAFQVLIGGMLASALAHPALILFILYTVFVFASGAEPPIDGLNGWLFALDLFNLASSYVVFAAMGLVGMAPGERKAIKSLWLLAVPVYWLAMSLAAWRAIGQLRRKAHVWEKTPHPRQPRRTAPPPPAQD